MTIKLNKFASLTRRLWRYLLIKLVVDILIEILLFPPFTAERSLLIDKLVVWKEKE